MDRKAAEYGVPVGSLPKRHIRLKLNVLEFQMPGKRLGLAVSVGARNTVIDFLQQRDIGSVVADHVDHALEAVFAIDAPDTLVDVIGKYFQSHVVMAATLLVRRQVPHFSSGILQHRAHEP